MFRTIRVACFAATAFLCSANSAFATDNDKIVATPAPADAAAPARIAAPAEASSAVEVALIPGRIRPDQAANSATAPAPIPAVGVTGAASPRPALAALVAQHSGSAVADDQFECLASAVYYESRGEPLEGQLGVAEVILNRVRSGRFRSTVCDVVTQPSQFSFVRRGVIPTAPRDSAAWHRAVAIAHIAMNNLADATGDTALFFHATSVNPRWGRPRIARIGNHIFYR